MARFVIPTKIVPTGDIVLTFTRDEVKILQEIVRDRDTSTYRGSTVSISAVLSDALIEYEVMKKEK